MAGFVSFACCLLIDWLADNAYVMAYKDSGIEMRYYAEKRRERG